MVETNSWATLSSLWRRMSARVPETSRIPFPLSPWVMWKALSFITTSASISFCAVPFESICAPTLAARAKTATVIALPTMYLMAHSSWLEVGVSVSRLARSRFLRESFLLARHSRYLYCLHFTYLGCELRKDNEYEEVSDRWSGGWVVRYQ